LWTDPISSCYLAIIPNLTRNGKSNGFIKMAIEYGKRNNWYKIILQNSFKRKGNNIFYENVDLMDTQKEHLK
jgi:hypothetical protein